MEFYSQAMKELKSQKDDEEVCRRICSIIRHFRLLDRKPEPVLQWNTLKKWTSTIKMLDCILSVSL